MATPIESTALNLEDWHLGASQQGSKGQKFAPINSPVYQIGTDKQPLFCPGGASSYSESARLNIDVDITDRLEIIRQLRAIDAWALQHGKNYQPFVHVHEKYGTIKLRCKVKSEGQSATVFWSPERKQLENPDLREASLVLVCN